MSTPEQAPKPIWHLLFATLLVGGVLTSFLYPHLWSLWLGPLHYSEYHGWLYPFLDMQGRIAAFEGHRAGIDMLHQANPFDPLGRLNVKPSWPLHLSFIGIEKDHLVSLSFATIALFLSFVIYLVRPKSLFELILTSAVCFSPPFLLGIERANDDLIYFCLLAAVPFLLARRSPLCKWIAWAWILLLTPAKFYPGAAYALLVLEAKTRQQLLLMLGLAAALLTIHVGLNIEELKRISEIVPRPENYMTHGLPSLAEALSKPALVKGLFLLAAGIVSLGIMTQDNGGFDHYPMKEQRWFILGSSVWFFCFAANSNYDYRLIFFTFMLPLLLTLARESQPKIQNYLARLTLLLLIPAFWCDVFFVHCFSADDGAWTYGHLAGVSIIKNMALVAVALSVTIISAQILRPNLCQLLNLKMNPNG